MDADDNDPDSSPRRGNKGDNKNGELSIED